MPELENARLTLGEAVPLLTTAVDRVGRESGLRLLFLKGPTLVAQGLRAPRPSADVDVLVHPADRAELLESLAQLGWRVDVEPTSAQVLTLHSITLSNPSWPCEIDVHDRFPGFLADPGDTFEALWRRRSTARVAGRDVPCPDLVAHGAVAALHWLRDGPASHEVELLNLCLALGERLDGQGRDELAALAVETGATKTLRPVLDRLGIATRSDDYDDTAWRIRTASTGVKSVAWVTELRRSPWWRRPAVLVHALMLTEAEIREAQPGAPAGWRGLQRARLHRLGRGLRDLPRALRIVRTAGRGG